MSTSSTSKSTSLLSSERENRLAKLQRLTEQGPHPYPAKFDKQQSLIELHSFEVGQATQTAGRLMRFRKMGKLAFAHIQDHTGQLQIIFKRDVLGDESFAEATKLLDLGDFVGVSGEIFVTQKGEQSIMVKQWTFLGKAILPLPAVFWCAIC